MTKMSLSPPSTVGAKIASKVAVPLMGTITGSAVEIAKGSVAVATAPLERRVTRFKVAWAVPVLRTTKGRRAWGREGNRAEVQGHGLQSQERHVPLHSEAVERQEDVGGPALDDQVAGVLLGLGRDEDDLEADLGAGNQLGALETSLDPAQGKVRGELHRVDQQHRRPDVPKDHRLGAGHATGTSP
jgi:hypothetical protein